MKKILYCLIFISLHSNQLAGATGTAPSPKVSDAALWTSIQINQDLPRKWIVGYEYQSRFTRNISFHRGHFQFLSLTWKPLDFFSATAEYRQVIAFDGNTHRLGLELNFKQKWNGFSIIKRTAFQSEIFALNTTEQPQGFPSEFWRERIMLRYDLNSKLRLICSAEAFFKIPTPLIFRRFRSQIGSSYELSKRTTLTAMWLFQEEFNFDNADITHAWLITTTVDLPNWWKKKKKKKDKQKKETSVLPENL